MHRSASTSRASDEFFINLSPASKGSPGVKVDSLAPPMPDISKKDATHLKLPGENFIHLIPIVLLLCAITLWAFSHPVLDLSQSDPAAALKVKGSDIHHSSANGTGFTSNLTPKEPGKSIRLLAQISGG